MTNIGIIGFGQWPKEAYAPVLAQMPLRRVPRRPILLSPGRCRFSGVDSHVHNSTPTSFFPSVGPFNIGKFPGGWQGGMYVSPAK